MPGGDHDQGVADPAGAAHGQRRLAALDALVFPGVHTSPEGEDFKDERAWAQGIVGGCDGPCRGLAPASVDQPWFQALRLVGIPFGADDGSDAGLNWGDNLLPDGSCQEPTLTGDQLRLPADPAQLLRLPGPALKPIRTLVDRLYGIRLQGPSRVAFTLWNSQALVLSTRSVPVGGFLHGPNTGQRQSLTLLPGAAFLHRWA
jgi:hypothetical protein